MTKKHFEAFAREIRALITGGPMVTDDRVARAFAEVIVRIASQDNPRFDRERFMKACGL